MIRQNQTEYSEIAIFAGNSRVSRHEENSSIIVEPQLAAFRAALERAREIENASGKMPRISIAFDHKNHFENNFIKDGLSSAQKRHPLFSHLRDEVTKPFVSIADDVGISLDNIHVLREDKAKSHVNHTLDQRKASEQALGLLTCFECGAISFAFFEKCLPANAKTLEIFYQNDPWSRTLTIANGVRIMKEMGHDIASVFCITDPETGTVNRHNPIISS